MSSISHLISSSSVFTCIFYFVNESTFLLSLSALGKTTLGAAHEECPGVRVTTKSGKSGEFKMFFPEIVVEP